MATSIIKRSGKKEQYQGYKIEEAIRKAFHSSGTAYNRSIYEEVEAKLSHQDSAHVEEVQDMIERALFRSGYFDTAKASSPTVSCTRCSANSLAAFIPAIPTWTASRR